MKKILRGTLALIVLSTSFAMAQVSTTTPVTTSAAKGASLTSVITKGDKAITTRITAINKSIANINKLKHLDDSMKTQLVSALNASLTDMNNVKAKLDADTDLATAKADYSSIFKDNRVEEIVLPQTKGAAKIDNMLASISSTTLSDLATKISNKASIGKDVSSASTTLADAQSKFDELKSKSSDYLNLMSTLKVDHGDKSIISSNNSILSQAKAIRATIQSDLNTFKTDLSSIKKDLKKK
jgi:hypothetical protein